MLVALPLAAAAPRVAYHLSPMYPDDTLRYWLMLATTGAAALGLFTLSCLGFGSASNLRLLDRVRACFASQGAAPHRREGEDTSPGSVSAGALRDWLWTLGVLCVLAALPFVLYMGFEASSLDIAFTYALGAIAIALLTSAALCLAAAKSLRLRARLAAQLLVLDQPAEQNARSMPGGDEAQNGSLTQGATRGIRDWLQAVGVLCLLLAPITPYNVVASTRAYLAYPSWDLVALMWAGALVLGLVALSSLSFAAIRALRLLGRVARELPPQHADASPRAPVYLYISGVLCLLPTPLFVLFPSEWDHAFDGSLEAFVALLALGTALVTLAVLSFAAAKDRYLLNVVASQLESDQCAASAGPEARLLAADVISPASAAVTASRFTGAPRLRSALVRIGLVALGVLALLAATLVAHRQAMFREAPRAGPLLEHAGQHEEALRAYDWVIRSQPDDANAHSSRGALLALLHRDGEAMTALRRAAELDPQDASAYSNMAVLLARHGRRREALAAAARAISLRPSDPKMHSSRAWVLAELGSYDEALAAYNRVIELKPDDPSPHLSRGWLLSELGRYGEALQAYDRAIQLRPDDPNTRDNRGWVLANLGRHEDALKEFERAIRLDPRAPIPYADKGRSLAALGRPREALAAYRRAVELDPDCVYARYSRALALGRMGRHREALAEFSRITQLQPDDERAHFGKGYELAELGRNEDAVAAYDRAIELKPDDAYAHYNRACTYAVLGRTKQSLSDLERAVELDGKLREAARTDNRFRPLRSDPEFKRLVGTPGRRPGR